VTTNDWPLRSYLELGALDGAVPSARLHTRLVVCEWGLPMLAEAAELLVSEIVTNAVKASRPLVQPRVVRLWLLSDKERVLILVWDASPHPPVPPGDTTGEIRESGRGLMLVEAISDRWSWYSAPGTGGKVVWALCGPGPAAEKARDDARL
jgi:anti-sigma regulatory factor (Ser/Thr protein kinase)